MSWRAAPLLALFVLACATPKMKVKKGEPQTAREKMLAEEKAKKASGEDDDAKPPGSKKWAGWRYQGDRADCFYLVGRRCFKTEKAACNAAKCTGGATCETTGAGPAQISCRNPDGSTVEPADTSDKKAKAKSSKRSKQPPAKPAPKAKARKAKRR